MDSKSERWALFWCHLLHDLLFEELEPHERGRRLRDLASQAVECPDGKTRTPSLSTLRRKLTLYRKKGFDSLERKARSDRGGSQQRKNYEQLIARAIELKKDLPTRGYRTISKMLELEFGRTLSKSTLYRWLREDPQFKLDYLKFRAEVVGHASGLLAANLVEASETILSIIRDEKQTARVRLTAARLMFTQAYRWMDEELLTAGLAVAEKKSGK